MTDPGWELCRSFLATLRAGSLSGAARALRLTQPTIGRHIAELEAALGVSLFVRSQRGLAATEAALDLLPHAEAMAAAAQALVRAASGEAEEMRGTVRITASEIVGAEILPPMLARFRALHPGIVVELVLSNRVEDLLRRDADIAVRMVRPTQAALVARRLGRVALGIYAHRRYLEAAGEPRDITDLAAHAVIGFDRDPTYLELLPALGLPVTRDMFAFRTDSDLAQLAALRAGFGVGICQVRIARRDPGLVRLFPDRFEWRLELWLAMHEDLRGSRRIRQMYDHLAAALAAHVGGSEEGGKPGD